VEATVQQAQRARRVRHTDAHGQLVDHRQQQRALVHHLLLQRALVVDVDYGPDVLQAGQRRNRGVRETEVW